MVNHVGIRFLPNGGKMYVYKTLMENLQRGDVVVLDSANGLGLGEVVLPNTQKQEHLEKATAWALCKVDVEGHRIEIMEYLHDKG